MYFHGNCNILRHSFLQILDVSIIIDEFYWNYYTYYYRRAQPKVDVRIVIAVTISVISACQYYVAWSNYKSAVNYLIQVPKHRMRAMDIAKKEKLFETDKKKQRGKTKVNTESTSTLCNEQLQLEI